MMPTLELCFEEKIIENYPIGAGDTLLVGRNSVNDIIIDNLSVSAQHAKIESIGDEFLFVDLQSENGSFVNDQFIKSHWLKDGDVVTIGKHVLKFSSPGKNKRDKIKTLGSTNTMRIETKKYRELIEKNKSQEAPGDEPPPIGRPGGQRPQLAVLSYLTGKKETVQISAQMLRIGKDPNSDILVKGLGVGKTAAVINSLSDGWYIKYVGGFSKPRLNAKALKSSAVKLDNLDIIAIGGIKLQFLLLRSAAAK
jgi:pSer/pThr/pTyr-binding forkhead associated (FHA) protein